jgi:FKBP-type peptidyl-prolyl cis-trans isomerase SlyD
MKITNQCVVALTWVLKDASGEELDVLDEGVEFLIGGEDLLHVMEHALEGKQVGDRVKLRLEPEQAFGDYDETLVFWEDRAKFPKDLYEGVLLDQLPQGCTTVAPTGMLLTVTEIYPEHVVLDGNHPLAGLALNIDIKVEAVREATLEEVGAGTAGTGFFRIAPINSDFVQPDDDAVH